MVKNHSDSEKGNPLPPISSKGSFICIIPDRITHTMVFVTPVVEHWLERYFNKKTDISLRWTSGIACLSTSQNTFVNFIYG